MATAIADGLRQAGTEVKQMSMHACHRSDVITELMGAGALIVGTPVLNSQMFPAMADVLCYIRGLKPKNLIGAAFGSYGWNGAPIDNLTKYLEEMGVEIVAPAVKSLFVPDDEKLIECENLGKLIGQKLTEKLQ